jgi:hypothetical protein
MQGGTGKSRRMRRKDAAYAAAKRRPARLRKVRSPVCLSLGATRFVCLPTISLLAQKLRAP